MLPVWGRDRKEERPLPARAMSGPQRICDCDPSNLVHLGRTDPRNRRKRETGGKGRRWSGG
eukprot:scaffold29610_cov28-Tisochrysis_lutea.AAC.2